MIGNALEWMAAAFVAFVVGGIETLGLLLCILVTATGWLIAKIAGKRRQ